MEGEVQETCRRRSCNLALKAVPSESTEKSMARSCRFVWMFVACQVPPFCQYGIISIQHDADLT